MSTPRESCGEFKERNDLASRQSMVHIIKTEYPDRIPIILERSRNEKSLPALEKTKYMVPHDLSMLQFYGMVRKRLSLLPNQAFFLLVDNRSMASMSATMAEIYRHYQDADGFLYLSYAAEDTFGTLR